VENRYSLRLAHGTLLGLMQKHDGKTAMALAQQMLAWFPMDNIGVRLLLDILPCSRAPTTPPCRST
jgi:hypothetical protein